MGNCGNSREMAPRRRHVASNQCWRGERLKSRELRPVPPPPCLPAALRSRGKSRESGAGQGAAAQPWRPSGAGGGGGGGAAGAEGGGGGGAVGRARPARALPSPGAMSQGGGATGESGEPEAKVLHTKRLYR